MAEAVGEGAAEGISFQELQLAARNHAMPLEALRFPITPVGLHYLLIHYDVPVVDPAAWRLTVGGHVERELSLGLDELRARPAGELTVTMECAGNGRAHLDPRPVSQPWLYEAVGTARWRGMPLPPQHGFPLRLVVPGWYGMTNVKWLASIEVLDHAFDGYQQAWAYHLRQAEEERGEPVDRMLPRSLVVPPGIPDFHTRERVLEAGDHVLEGRAWSGRAPVEGVEVSTDGGATWAAAELEPAEDRWAWRGWRFRWQAEPGRHLVCSRARDDAGNEQPLEPAWNIGGYGNNAVQTVVVN